MSVKVSMWGAAGSSPLILSAVPSVGDSIVVEATAYPVLAVAYGDGEVNYAQVGAGTPFGGAPPAPAKRKRSA